MPSTAAKMNLPGFARRTTMPLRTMLLPLAIVLPACGDTSFTSASPTTRAPTTTATTTTVSSDTSANVVTKLGGGTSGAALTWDWPCTPSGAATGAPAPSVAAATAAQLITGPGVHTLSTAPANGASLVLEGQLCQPATLPRDVLFVIDVSGSMQQNDPRHGSTCGRLQAIQTVLNSMPPGNAQFAILTFDSNVENASTAMFANQTALFTDLSGGGNIADVVCSFGSDTNYSAALSAANTVLSKGRANATKEIYFVSDGEPTFGEDGMAQAQQLTNSGVVVGGATVKVTLATVMLNGTGAPTEIAMSSLGPNGQPLHADVANSAGLAQALSTLSSNGIASASVEYRPTGSGAYVTASLTSYLNGSNFSLPALPISASTDPNGVDVLLRYTDQRGNQYQSTGTVSW